MSSTAVLAPRPSAPALDAADAGDLTAEVAMRWACAPGRWRGTVQHVTGERWYAPLFGDERLCGWLITWAPGTTLDLHDHGGAVGSVVVVEGSLRERFRDRRRIEPFATRVLAAGSMVTFSADHVHEVTNAGEVPAVSIHVYAPSLDGMTFYEEDPTAAAIRPTRTEPRAGARSEVPSVVASEGSSGASTVERSSAASAAPAKRPASLAAAWLQGFR